MAFYIWVYAYAVIVHTRADLLLPQLLMEQLYNVDTLNICMKEFDSKILIFVKMTAIRDNFFLVGRFYSIDSALMGRSTPTTAFGGAF